MPILRRVPMKLVLTLGLWFTFASQGEDGPPSPMRWQQQQQPTVVEEANDRILLSLGPTAELFATLLSPLGGERVASSVFGGASIEVDINLLKGFYIGLESNLVFSSQSPRNISLGSTGLQLFGNVFYRVSFATSNLALRCLHPYLGIAVSRFPDNGGSLTGIYVRPGVAYDLSPHLSVGADIKVGTIWETGSFAFIPRVLMTLRF